MRKEKELIDGRTNRWINGWVEGRKKGRKEINQRKGEEGGENVKLPPSPPFQIALHFLLPDTILDRAGQNYLTKDIYL